MEPEVFVFTLWLGECVFMGLLHLANGISPANMLTVTSRNDLWPQLRCYLEGLYRKFICSSEQ